MAAAPISSFSPWQFLNDELLLCMILSFLEDGGDDIHHLWLLALDDDLVDLRLRLEQHFLLSVNQARHLAMEQSLWSVLCKLSHTTRYTKGQYLTEDQVDEIENELMQLSIPPHPDRRDALLTAVGQEHKTGSSRLIKCSYCGRESSHRCDGELHRCIAPGPMEEPHFCRSFSPFVMYMAAEKGYLGSVIWLHYVVCYDQERALSAAAYKGHADVVNWLLDHPHSNITVDFRFRDDEDLGVNAWRVSKFSQHYTMTKKWGVRSSLREYMPECLAADHGDVEGMRRIYSYELFRDGFRTRAGLYAGAAGHIDVLRFLYDLNPDFVKDSSAMWFAVEYGHHETVKWLVANECGTINDRAVRSAVIHGRVEILQWMLATVSDPERLKAIIEQDAEDMESLRILQWLALEDNRRVTTAHVKEAVSSSDGELAKWFVNHYISQGTSIKGKLLLETAIKHNKQELVEWFVKDLGFWSPKAFQLASMGRSSAILDCIYDAARNRPEFLSPLRSGLDSDTSLVPKCRRRFEPQDLETVQRLLDHGFRSGLFCIQAFDIVLRFERDHTLAQKQLRQYSVYLPTTIQRYRNLLCHIIEVYDPEFVRKVLWLPIWAASHGQLETLKRLAKIDHVNVFTRKTFDRLLLNNGSEVVVQWFLVQRPQLYTTLVVRWAVTHGKRRLVQWIFQSFLPVQTDSDLLLLKSVRTALWAAARYKRTDVMDMLPQWTPVATDALLRQGIPSR